MARTSESTALSSAIAAALAYHLGAVILAVVNLVRYPPKSIIGALDVDVAAPSLAAFAGAFMVRLTMTRLLPPNTSAAATIKRDLCVFATVLIVSAAIALPMDRSGAAGYSLVVLALIGIPSVAVLSALSVLYERSRVTRLLLEGLVLACVIVALGVSAVRLTGQL